ncbi:hypothetical protein AX17_002441 [Amanita inopinata Kibby_2008]|nr:hypothetical protein AX17_002441 [Amanita inopinata Kibby_2008]
MGICRCYWTPDARLRYAEMSTRQRQPYSGFQRRIVIAFDVGTTFSGVSYTILEPGQPPQIQGVTQFPGQQKIGGDSKIPSIVCYDRDGNVVAVGSETDLDTNPELEEIDGLVRAEWFKLHLRPPHLASEQGFDIRKLPPLPRNKTAIDVFGDLLSYLYRSTKQYIRERQGNDLWTSVEKNVDFVLSHPNGWEGKQQSEMRRAAAVAGLVSSESEALQRISFVTEGEASLHFCLSKSPAALDNHAGNGVLVVDCGGGTVDISAYTRFSGKQFKEIAAPECLLQGSVFVTRRAHGFLTEKLRRSKFGGAEEIETMTKFFDKTTKPSFKGSSKPYFIRFGRGNDNDPEVDIRSGSIKLVGTQVAAFFEPAIQSIIKVIEDQIRVSSIPIKAIFLVGGFATSDYLYSKLDEHFKARGVDILRPDAYLNKAVAEGAVSFHIDHFVSTRVSKFTYGTEVSIIYNSNYQEHSARKPSSYIALNGQREIPGAFSVILTKDIAVSEEKEFRKGYYQLCSARNFNSLQRYSAEIKCYRGRSAKAPEWLDSAPNLFPDLCVVTADMSGVKKSLQPHYNQSAQTTYYRVEFEIVLLFGLTELKAQIAWKENGVERRGPASIVYDVTSIKDN